MNTSSAVECHQTAFLFWTEKAVSNPIKWGIFVAGSVLLSYWEWDGLPLRAGIGLIAYAVQNLLFTLLFARDGFTLRSAKLLILVSYTVDFLFVAWLISNLKGTASQVAFLLYVSLFFKAGLYYPAFKKSLLILPLAVLFYLLFISTADGIQILSDYSFRPQLFLLLAIPAVVVYSARLLDHRERDLWDLNKKLQSNSAQMRRQTKELEAIIDGMRDGLVVTDPTLNVVALNQVARSILRWGTDLELPHPLISSENGQSLRELIAETVASSNQSNRREIRFPCPSKGEDEAKTYQAVASCISGENGVVVRVVIILRDITEQIQLEDAKSNFLSVVTHELRTPLSSIKGFITLILAGRAGQLNETQKDFLTTAKGQAENLHAMINDLVEFSRIQVQRTELELSPVSLYEISKVVCARLLPLADDKRIDLTNNVPVDLPMIEGDQLRLEQVVTNLICNALKFTAEGGTITLSAQYQTNELTFFVQDTGVGIPEEELDKVFEPFYQVSRGTARVHGGMGLGLAICKSIVGRHQGRIAVRSTEGKGSVFYFSLPKRVMFQEKNDHELVFSS